jgi:hypothetical protein
VIFEGKLLMYTKATNAKQLQAMLSQRRRPVLSVEREHPIKERVATTGTAFSEKSGGLNRSMQHHLM